MARHRALRGPRVLLALVAATGVIVTAAAAFALPFPGWLHPSHPMARVAHPPRSGGRPITTAASAAAASSSPSSPSPSSSSSSPPPPDVCRPRRVDELGESQDQDCPELRSLLGGLGIAAPLETKEEEEEDPQLHDKGRQAQPQEQLSPSHVSKARSKAASEVAEGSQVDWWAQMLTSSLREDYERHLSDTRAPATVQDHLQGLRRLFREAGPSLVSVTDALLFPLATREELRNFLTTHQQPLLEAVQGMPLNRKKKASPALRQLMEYAAGHAAEELWPQVVSPALEGQFKAFLRVQGRSEASVLRSIRALRRLFRDLPLEDFERPALRRCEAAGELDRFLRRHYLDLLDAMTPRAASTSASAGIGASTGSAAQEEDALAQLLALAMAGREAKAKGKGRGSDVMAIASLERAYQRAEKWRAAVAGIELRAAAASEQLLAGGSKREEEEVEVEADDVVDTPGLQPARDAEAEEGEGEDVLEAMLEAVHDLQEEEEREQHQHQQQMPQHQQQQEEEEEPSVQGGASDRGEANGFGKRVKRRWRKPWRRE